MLIFLEICFAVITFELGYFSHENLKYDGSDWVNDYHKYEKEKQIAFIMRRFKYTQSFIGTGIYLIILIQVFNWFPGRLIH